MSLEKTSQAVVDLSKKIGEAIVIDGNLATVGKDLYETNLPEGLDLATVKRVQEHNLDFSDAVTLALGERGLVHLKDNKDIEALALTVNIGHDRITSEFRRHRQYRNPADNTTLDKYGVAETKYVSGINAKRPAYKEIQAHLSTQAESIFKQ